jgi:hypothetical protein
MEELPVLASGFFWETIFIDIEPFGIAERRSKIRTADIDRVMPQGSFAGR